MSNVRDKKELDLIYSNLAMKLGDLEFNKQLLLAQMAQVQQEAQAAKALDEELAKRQASQAPAEEKPAEAEGTN